ncbi:unnamed protein product [Phytophthora fragariaefolia]|uniref:Unnamed protein product n=1 Tax=Phytophthora fragariaefolia TaxID=1490495 RepID=A0A9W6YJY4_9STRA|nr:unnamed protein product [Phytophthora fragariaefolia]
MSFISKVAGLYQKSVSNSFRMYGLKYDDALVDTAAVQTALHWVTGEDYNARTKRIARAADCSLKRSYLPDEIQAIQRPLDFYISDKVDEAEKLAAERADLTRWPTSAKPTSSRKVLSARPEPVSYMNHDLEEDEEEEVVEDDDQDDDSGEFGDAAEQERKLRQQVKQPLQERRNWPGKVKLSESEFKKKISVKIEQANKMMTANGSTKSFGPTPVRRMVARLLFVADLTKLALLELTAGPRCNNPGKPVITTSSRTKNPFQRGGFAPRSRLSAGLSSGFRESSSDSDATRSRPPKIKPSDRTQVQEELRSVLEGTIELTKVLQEQLHELKLKGWNVAPRS